MPQNADALARQPLVEIDQVVKTFHTPAGEFSALKGVTAHFYPGEFVSIVGKSGSGKSTLANMITGIDHPTSGRVLVGGVELHRLSESDMSVWRGRNLGIVFQFFQLLPMLTLLENVMLPMDFGGLIPANEREERAMGLLRMVDLEAEADKLPAAVSGGQQQSAAIARALANDPPLVIADEPTGNLDSRTAEAVFEIFNELVAAGKTIIMVTHDPSLAARTGRVLHIADGELVNDPPPSAPDSAASHAAESYAVEKPVQAVGPLPLAVGPQPLAVGPQPLAVGPQPLAVGPQPLAVGPQPLAVGPQPLAVGPQPLAVGPLPAMLGRAAATAIWGLQYAFMARRNPSKAREPFEAKGTFEAKAPFEAKGAPSKTEDAQP